MKVKIDKHMIEVCQKDCGKRDCFVLGFDKGSFTQGKGYTSYHKDSKGKTVEYPVCMTRHLHGCPIHSVCPICKLCSIDPPGSKCYHYGCTGITIERSQ